MLFSAEIKFAVARPGTSDSTIFDLDWRGGSTRELSARKTHEVFSCVADIERSAVANCVACVRIDIERRPSIMEQAPATAFAIVHLYAYLECRRVSRRHVGDRCSERAIISAVDRPSIGSRIFLSIVTAIESISFTFQ